MWSDTGRDLPSIEEVRHLLVPTADASRWDEGELPQAVLNLDDQTVLARCGVLLRLAVVADRSLDGTRTARVVALREVITELLPKDFDHPFCSVLRALAGLEQGTAGRRREQRQEVAGRVLGPDRHPIHPRSVRRRVKEDCWSWLLDRLIDLEVGARRTQGAERNPLHPVVSPMSSVLVPDMIAQRGGDPEAEPTIHDGNNAVPVLRAGASVPAMAGLVGPFRPVPALIEISDLTAAEAVPYLHATFKGYIREDRLLGPVRLIPAVTVHLTLIERLLGCARSPERQQVLEIGSRFAEFAGWLCQDAGSHGAALHWSERASEWAAEAGNHVMVAYVLMRKSNQTSDAGGDAASIIRLAEAAQRAERPLPRQVTALALRQEAHGYAMAADERSCHSKLDRARDLAALSQRDGDEGPGGYCTESYIELHRAHCWTELDKPHRAIDVFEQELSSWPSLQHRDRGVFLSRMALAYARACQPEQAAATAEEALRIVLATGSGRITTELTRLFPLLGRWRHLPEVASVHNALTAFFLTAQGTRLPAC